MRRLAYIALASALLASSLLAGSQKPSGAETGLLGVHLYDSGVKVITMFGSPNSIEAVSIGGSGGGGGNGGGGPIGGAGGPGGPGGGTAGPAPPPPGTNGRLNQFDDFGNGLLQAGSILKPHEKTGNPLAGAGNGSAPTLGGGTGNGNTLGPSSGPGAGNNNTNNSGEATTFTRWIYNRAGCKYGFVFDKFNRVVQIEAIGMGNAKVHTARGIRFGSTFGQIIKRYNTKNAEGGTNAPDGYEVAGDSFTVRYLVKNKVAFRLNRLAKDGPQVVTAIAVSAGKQ
jgi:hypothetical protein